ncbi:MAG TPA: hypothetical protein VJB95_02885 [Candidatus Paceibacterota bacterium]
MWYLIIIVVALFIIRQVAYKTFYWDTVIKHLWKQVYWKADNMASHMEQFGQKEFEKLNMEGFKAEIEFRGKLINSILDYINNIKREDGETLEEEETFGYGRYDFDKILMLAKSNPKAFEKFE